MQIKVADVDWIKIASGDEISIMVCLAGLSLSLVLYSSLPVCFWFHISFCGLYCGILMPNLNVAGRKYTLH
jgi:hypothetical protein